MKSAAKWLLTAGVLLVGLGMLILCARSYRPISHSRIIGRFTLGVCGCALAPDGTLFAWDWRREHETSSDLFRLAKGRVEQLGIVPTPGLIHFAVDNKHLVSAVGDWPASYDIHLQDTSTPEHVRTLVSGASIQRLSRPVSPDGSSILISSFARGCSLATVNVKTGLVSRIVNCPSLWQDAVWTSDGRSVVYAAEDQDGHVFMDRIDLRSRKDIRLWKTDHWIVDTTEIRCSPDGKHVAYLTGMPGTAPVLKCREFRSGREWTLARLDGKTPIPFISHPVSIVPFSLQWSDDGRYVAWLGEGRSTSLFAFDTISHQSTLCEQVQPAGQTLPAGWLSTAGVREYALLVSKGRGVEVRAIGVGTVR